MGSTPSYSCICDNPFNVYARYSEVVFKPGGEVVLTKRADFEDPFCGLPIVELINLDGRALESVIVEGQVFHLSRNIPFYFPTGEGEKLFSFSKIELKMVLKKEKSSIWPGYFNKRWILSEVRTLRDSGAEEIKSIERIPTLPVADVFVAEGQK